MKNKFLMDIFLLAAENNIKICPNTILGMLWLQTHFEKEHWDSLASNHAQIPREEISNLVEDAHAAGLKLNFLENLCIAENF